MDKKIRWLRISYWTGALGDFLIAGMVLIPEINAETHFSLPMGMMSAAAISWGVMLLVADRKPIERRWILLPTMLVVALLGVVMILGGFAGLIPASSSIIRALAFLAVFILLFFSYHLSKD
jgi:drug/metabolite transporter (DMT)-like permease